VSPYPMACCAPPRRRLDCPDSTGVSRHDLLTLWVMSPSSAKPHPNESLAALPIRRGPRDKRGTRRDAARDGLGQGETP
jgi:hypothetical protein